MKTTLFNALASAGVVVCNGYEVDGQVFNVPGVVRLECGDDVITHLPDQVIEIDSDGQAAAVINEASEDDDKVDLIFRVTAPMRVTDLIDKTNSTSDDPLREISLSGGVKSISDDDLCASCTSCQYKPGEMSGCEADWPGRENVDGYVRVCVGYIASPDTQADAADFADVGAPKVSVDGGVTWSPINNDVRVSFMGVDGDDTDLNLIVTHEGVIVDVVTDTGEVTTTAALDLDYLVGTARPLHQDQRSIACDPRLFIEQLGYDIDKDSDQPGLWVWTAATDGCDSSFPTAEEALNGGWNDAVAQTLSISKISCEAWGAMTFEQQKTAMLRALSEDGDALQDVVADVLQRARKFGFTPDEDSVRESVEGSASLLGILLNDGEIRVACTRVISATTLEKSASRD